MLAEQTDFVIGVDTHRDRHSAAILASNGGLVDETSAAADQAGYTTLLGWGSGTPQPGGCGRSRGRARTELASPPSLSSRASGWSRSAGASAAAARAAPRATRSTQSKRHAKRWASPDTPRHAQ